MGLGDMAKGALGKGAQKGAEKASSNAAHKSLSGDSDSPSHGNVGEGASNDGSADKSANGQSSHLGSEADTFDGGNDQGGDLDDKMRDKATQKGAQKAGEKASDKLGQGNGQGLGQGDNGLISQAGGSSANGGGANAGGASNANAGSSVISNAMSGVANAAGSSTAGAAGSAAAGAAGAAGGASLGSTIVSAASNIAHAAAGALSGIVSSVTSTVAAGIGAVSSAIGVAASTVTTVAVGGAVAATVVVGATTAVIVSNNPGAYDTVVSHEDCATSVSQAKAAAEEVDADAAMLENAQKLYSVFKTRGWSDEMIAGMLSNFQAEGSIDPTCIEGIYDEPYTMGTKKTEAVNDNFQSQCSYLFGAYAKQGLSINQDAYRADDGNYYPGLGLCQWTGPGAKRLLDYANSVSAEWHDMGYQIAYIIANGSPCIGTSFEEKYKSECGSADAATCARFFALKFENGAMPEWMIETHTSSASSWASKMSSWTVDSSFANSIIAMAEKMGASASTSTVASAQKKCQKASNVDNSSLASAAVSYAWEHAHPDAEGNNGTQLYQAVCDGVIGDGLYMSCDHGVCAAVRWSGTDVDYPSGNCSTQWSYVTSSDKWERVGTLGVDLQYEDLQPGDVAICAMSDSYTGGSEHTWLYVGNEAVKAKYADSTYTSVNASYGQRSAGCSDDSWSVNGESRGHYGIFRCVNPDNSDQYKDVGAGQSGTS